jgi:small subunit ribosomal protein S17
MAQKKKSEKEAPKAAKAPAAAPAVKAAPAKAEPAKAAPAPAPAKVEPVKAEPAKVEAPAAGATTAPVKTAHGFRHKMVGRVTSSKMNKTVVVEVVRSSLDPVYKKYVRERTRYKAHDETNQYKVGDRVEIQEHRPISRDKRWLVTRLVSRPVEE